MDLHTHALLYRLNISQQLLTVMPFFLFILLESCNLFSILTFFTLADWYVYQHVNHCWNCLTQKLVLTFYFNYYCLLKKFLPPKTTRSLVCYTTFCRWSPKYQCEQKKYKPIERKKSNPKLIVWLRTKQASGATMTGWQSNRAVGL